MKDFPFDTLPKTEPVRIKPEPRFVAVGAQGQYRCKVSEEDYDFVMQWKWTYKKSAQHLNSCGVYARRTGPRDPETNTRRSIQMHVIICERAHGPRPSPEHTVDHDDNDTMNNTRENLKWATKAEQYANRRPSKKHVQGREAT